MRLVHLSDTHLGFSAYSRLDQEQGINQREVDIYEAFRKAVDKTIELRPDVVLHSGDLFDAVRPMNRAIDFAMRQLLRLSEAGIETILISGNHSTPRLRETGNIFRIFEHLEHVHPVHEPGATRITLGDLTVTAVPHSTLPPLDEIVSNLRPLEQSKYNVLVLHASISDSDRYRMDEFNEQAVPMNALTTGWDYVALGHWHKHDTVGDRVCYSGSTERMGFGEADQDKGLLEVDLDTREITFHRLEIRDMLDLPPIDASGMASSEILNKARDILSSARIDDKIVRLTVKNVSPDAYKSLDIPAIKRMASTSLHLDPKIDRLDVEGRKEEGSIHIGLLQDEFRKYVTGMDLSDEKKRMLIDLALPYFATEDER